LLLNEVTLKNIFYTVTFGLLDGWWIFEDEKLRISGSPLLDPENWKSSLQQAGFINIELPLYNNNKLGQQIIVAQSDGIVIRKINQDVINKDRSTLKLDIKRDEYTTITENKTLNLATAKINTNINSDIKGNSDINIKILIKEIILELLSKSLKVAKDNIDEETPFFDYGVDSIIGVNFINLLNEKLNLNINTAILFDFTNVDLLTKHLIKTYGDEITTKIQQLNLNDTNCKNEEVVNYIHKKNIKNIDIDLIKNDLTELEYKFFNNNLTPESLIKEIDKIKLEFKNEE
jgi:acyl carrier protein